jgi:hypothetical protein
MHKNNEELTRSGLIDENRQFLALDGGEDGLSLLLFYCFLLTFSPMPPPLPRSHEGLPLLLQKIILHNSSLQCMHFLNYVL